RLLVEGGEDELLQGAEAAGSPQPLALLRGLGGLRFARKARRDGEDLWLEPEQTDAVGADELDDLGDLLIVPQQVDLVEHDDDLFPPAADLGHELPLTLG